MCVKKQAWVAHQTATSVAAGATGRKIVQQRDQTVIGVVRRVQRLHTRTLMVEIHSLIPTIMSTVVVLLHALWTVFATLRRRSIVICPRSITTLRIHTADLLQNTTSEGQGIMLSPVVYFNTCSYCI